MGSECGRVRKVGHRRVLQKHHETQASRCGTPSGPPLPSSKDPPALGDKPLALQPPAQLPQPYQNPAAGRGSPLCLSFFLCPCVCQAFVPLPRSTAWAVGYHLHTDALVGSHCSLCPGLRIDGLGLQTLFGFKMGIASLI